MQTVRTWASDLSDQLWYAAAGRMAYSRAASSPKEGSKNQDKGESSGLARQLGTFLTSRTKAHSQRSWVEKTFFKRECSKFIRSSKDSTRCCCGRFQDWHGILPNQGETTSEKWHPLKFTEHKPTDAYGTIEFQGAPHPSKAQYVRMSSYDTRPEHVLHLLQKHWGLDLPKLLITVHGGILNFDIQPKLKRVFRKGLLKAARTTGAWIITGGTNTGVTKHVGDAISDRTSKTKNKVVAIGIAPWGVVENKESLIGRDTTVPYHCVSSPKTNTAVLNSNHSYFLLLDNGTVGKYGGEIIFRKKFEKFIAQQKICIRSGVKGHGVPVICVVLEGGANTIRSVLEYVTDTPPVPVVVCDGSGRAADLLAFTHKYTLDDGTMPESLRDQLILTIQKTFQYSQEQAEKLFIELMLCVKKKELITVFRMGEGSQDIDLAILTALLKGTNASASDQLNLALTWDRVDIARSHIFVYGQEWPEGCLEQAMMDALIHDRVDFVKLLLENGVSMHTFLTIPRLEELYNTHHGPSNTLRYLVRDAKKRHLTSSYRFTLPDIGLVIQLLMGGAFRSSYCRRRFRQKYNAIKQNGVSLGNVVTAIPQLVNCRPAEELFPYPFHDLMIWAVLMKRQKMALFMWQHGEEALAKSLMACKMYKAMAHEADQDDLEIELSQEFHQCAKEFQTHALELLEHCYKIDDDYTQQLLTYELKNFSEQTSLGLAVMASHLDFIAHTCCQLTLNDLWIGGLRTRKNLSIKVILGILMPPFIAFLDFKSKEELQLMPQTMEEHLEELEDDNSDFDAHSVNSSFDDDQNDFGDEVETSFHSGSQGPAKENGAVHADTSTYTNVAFKKKKSPLRFSKKIYEFYNAPITKFWTHTMAYLFFIICFIYTVLDRPKIEIQWPEYLVMCYIFTCALEKIRQIISSEPSFACTKIRVFLSHAWNIWDMFGIALFSVGVGLRMYPETLAAANLVYVTDLIFWIIRVLEILSVNKYLGPYVKIICKLLIDMMYFLLILFLVVTSFGIVRQVVHFQNKPETPWSYTLRNVWFYPYWNIYGELFADEIDPCDPNSPDYEDTCVYGSWLAPFIMTIYLLVANILMVNLLIARFNSTFIRNNAMSTQIWKFQRYQLIIGYENRTILPPPLTIFSHIFLFFKYLRRCCRGHKRDYFDNGLKLFLSHEDTEKLHDFEEECMEDYFREKEIRFQNSSEERIRVVYDRVENMSMRMDDMNQKENTIKLSLQSMDYRMNRLEELTTSMAENNIYLRNIFLQSAGLVPSQAFGSQETLPEFSEEAPSDEFSATGQPEAKVGMGLQPGQVESVLRPQASPILVHSKHPINSQELEKYTSRARQSSGGSINLREFQSVSGDSDAFVGETSNADNNVTAVPAMGLSLTSRRHGPTLRSINISKARMQGDRGLRGSLSPNLRVSNSAPPLRTAARSFSHTLDSIPVISTAHIHSDTHLVTPSAVKPSHLSLAALRDRNANENSRTPVSPEVAPLSPSKSIPHSAATFITADATAIPTSAVRDLSSILTPLQAEYTSITDDIDTSCMQDRSPQRSPTTAGVFFSESFPDPGEKSKEPVATSVELESLKQAEEVERRRIDKLIRPRLRQISLDESDGKMSEIAKRVVDDLDKDEDSPAVEEEEEADSEDVEEEDDDDDPVYEGGIEITISAAPSDSSGEESRPVV